MLRKFKKKRMAREKKNKQTLKMKTPPQIIFVRSHFLKGHLSSPSAMDTFGCYEKKTKDLQG